MSDYTKISCLLLIGIVLCVAGRLYAGWLARRDAEWAAKNPPEPDQQAIAAEHVAKILPASLRKPLPPYRNMDGAARATWPKYFHSYANAADSEGGHHD